MITSVERANLVVATRIEPSAGLQALVGKKLRGAFKDMVMFPGGKLLWDDDGLEDRHIAAQREFAEETGISMAVDELRLAGRIRLFGDRFGMIDVYHTQVAGDTEPTSGDEMQLQWRTLGPNFYSGMPEDTEAWLPLVFSDENFRLNTFWRAGNLCMIANGNDDSVLDIQRYFTQAALDARPTS